jgi:hypothetical protein
MAIKNLTDTHILGKLGVGTNSPTSTLQVDGQVLISATAPLLDFVDTNSFSDANDRFRVRAGSNQGLIQWYDDSSSSLLSIITFEPNGNVIVPNGSIGIGTTTPIGSLDVANDGLFLTSTNTSSRNWLVAGNYLSWGDFALVQSDAFGTDPYPPANSTPRFYINTAGNVGIGTTSPSEKLDITDGRLIFTNTTSGRNSTIGMDDGYNFYIKNTALGNLYIGNGTTNHVNGNLNVDSGVLFVNASSDNVGIGTTSPNASLHIDKAGDQASSVKGIILSSGASGTNKYLPSITWSYGAYGTPDFAKIESQRGAGTGARILFSTANSSGTMSERMRINEDGNVGIGTTNPSDRLTVIGNISASGLTTDNIYGATYPSNSFIRFDDDQTASSNNVSIGSIGRINYLADTNGNHPTADPAHQFFTGSSDIDTATSLMTITAAGNVGIGIPNPTAAGGYTPILHIASPYPALAIQNTATGSRKYQLGVDSVAAFNIYDANDTETRLSIASNGNVFIGNPPVFGAMEKLQVLGGLMIGDGAGRDYIEGFGTGELLSNDAQTGELRVGGGVLSANPYTMELSFLGEPILYGNVSDGTILMRSQIGVSESGFEDNDFGPNNYGMLLGPGISYTNASGGAPVGYPEWAYSGMLGGLISYDIAGFVSQVINTPSGDTANFSSTMGLGDVGSFQGAFTWNYTYGAGNMTVNPMNLEFRVFDFLGSSQLFFDPMGANTLFAPAFTPTSDRKLKENITNAPGLEVVKKLQGVEFDWKSNGKHSSGFIAQEVEEVIPHAVVESDTHKALNYNAIIAYQNEAIKELSDMVDLLKQEIEILKNK